MDIKKVLQDYISYHWIEEFITDEQKDELLKHLGVYIKGMIPQLTIHSVVDTLVCDCEIPKPKSPFMDDYGYDYCRDCEGHITK